MLLSALELRDQKALLTLAFAIRAEMGLPVRKPLQIKGSVGRQCVTSVVMEMISLRKSMMNDLLHRKVL